MSNQGRPRLAFVSPVFLLPADTGAKIRSRNILRGLKGGAFEVTLTGPGSAEQRAQWSGEIESLCDRFVPWRPSRTWPRWARAIDLVGQLPVNIQPDARGCGPGHVRQLLADERFNVVVFDFLHTSPLKPSDCATPTVCFTHNVEAEIFARHARTETHPLKAFIWARQAAKMRRYEHEVLQTYDRVIAVSARDAQHFLSAYGVRNVDTIPTGVDLDYFSWQEPLLDDPEKPPTIVFTGSMDWAPNVDGVSYFLSEVWPLVLRVRPDARFVVVGRHPPARLIRLGASLTGVRFTGFVDDVRPYVRPAHAFVIPLRVGGGTRIKAFEAMSMGVPVVSTAIGIEGLEVGPDTHYLLRDDAASLAQGLVDLCADASLRQRLSAAARRLVESRFGHVAVARVFEAACQRAAETAAMRAPTSGNPVAAGMAPER